LKNPLTRKPWETPIEGRVGRLVRQHWRLAAEEAVATNGEQPGEHEVLVEVPTAVLVDRQRPYLGYRTTIHVTAVASIFGGNPEDTIGGQVRHVPGAPSGNTEVVPIPAKDALQIITEAQQRLQRRAAGLKVQD